MRLDAEVPAVVATAVTVWAARHNASVGAVVARALVEYLADVDVGLLSPPAREARTLARVGRGRRNSGAISAQ